VVGESMGVAATGRVSIDKMSMNANLSRLGRASYRYAEDAKRAKGQRRSFPEYWKDAEEDKGESG
jgi:hypothetical protein